MDNDFLATTTARFGVPGAAVGVRAQVAGGTAVEEVAACGNGVATVHRSVRRTRSPFV